MARKTSRRSKKISTSRIRRDTITDTQSNITNDDNEKQRQSSSVNHAASDNKAHKDGTPCLCFLRKGMFLPPSEMMGTTTQQRSTVIDDSDLKIYDGTSRNSATDIVSDSELKSFDGGTRDSNSHPDTQSSSVTDSTYNVVGGQGERQEGPLEHRAKG